MDDNKKERFTDPKPFFENDKEQEEFMTRHIQELKEISKPNVKDGDTLKVYLGIDSGSTTSKFVLIDENENVIYKFYSNNFGEPIPVVKKGIIEMCKNFEDKGIKLEILRSWNNRLWRKTFCKCVWG